MPKYKVGDKVRVKDHRVETGDLYWILEMDKMFGKVVTIKAVASDGTYLIEEMGCTWADEMFEGLENSTGNEVIDLLMKKLGVEIDEEFEIEDAFVNPYHFDKNGNLLNSKGDKARSWVRHLVYGEATIKKIPKPEIKEMTVAELEEALGLPKGTLRVKGDQ